MKILVTGGAGFIGSAVIRHLVVDLEYAAINVDKLTYAGNLASLEEVSESPLYSFEQVDICDVGELKRIFSVYQPDKVMHLAAESHVDRSINSPGEFIQTNIFGTYHLLDAALQYYNSLEGERKSAFCFHHVSTDEVYGDLEINAAPFTETTPYSPSSPYSASKAASDHLIRAWHRTFGLPVVLSNCSNNYGPYQFPEKLIPLVILNALEGKPIPVYGQGTQIRDWLYVEDHARALTQVMLQGGAGETYNIGGHNEKQNIEVVKAICRILDELRPNRPAGISAYEDLIDFVADRPGHDVRYAIDASKIERDLGWIPSESFASGIRKTVQWYLDNAHWWQPILDKSN